MEAWITSIVIAVLAKYAVNIINAIEAKFDANFANWIKQGVVIVLAYAATHWPILAPYLPHGIDPNALAALVATGTTVFHHAMELLLLAIQNMKASAPAKK